MRVLIIAPYFAPNLEVAAVRMVSLSSQLVASGHAVSVLCLSYRGLLRENTVEELTAKVPEGVKTIRFDIDYSTLPLIADYVNGKRFARVLPDLVNPADYDVLLNTCGPYYPLEAAPIIARWGLPYILDFRDLGAINYRPTIVSGSKDSYGLKVVLKSLYGKLIKRRERRAVRLANHVICISAIDLGAMRAAYGLEEARSSVVTNGFDEDRLGAICPHSEKPYNFTAGVFGKFMYYDKDKATAILEALCGVRADGIDAGLVHIGKKYGWIDDVIESKGIDPACYTNLGLMEYEVGMAYLGTADFFVVEDTSPDDVGTKIYDYIFWNKPVIAVVPPSGPLAKFVSSFRNGFVCTTSAEVRVAVERIVTLGLDCLDPDLDRDRYSRRHQNELIESILENEAKEMRAR